MSSHPPEPQTRSNRLKPDRTESNRIDGSGAQTGSNRRKPDGTGGPKRSTREKIEKLVADGARNYPAYLKLIYTGDSEQSSEDENALEPKTSAVVLGDDWGETCQRRRVSNVSNCSSSNSAAVMRAVLSPESLKLMDPGKEKLPTPTDGSCTDAAAGEEEEQSIQESSSEAGDRIISGGVTYDDCAIDDNDEPKRNGTETQQKVEEKWKLELFQLQDDIVSLKAMLRGKMQVASELKQRLGITHISELKRDLKYSLLSFRESGTYQKTNSVLRSLSSYASRKMGAIRNSLVFKSVEEKVVKVKSRSMGHIKSKLSRTLPASKSDSNVTQLKKREMESSCDSASQNWMADSISSQN